MLLANNNTKRILFLTTAVVMIITLHLVYRNTRAIARLQKNLSKLEDQPRRVENRISDILLSQEDKLNSIQIQNGENTPKGNETSSNVYPSVKNEALEQARRRKVIDELCKKDLKSKSLTKYQSVRGFHQEVSKWFLVDERSRSMYCYNHKAGSSTWMTVFTKLYPNQKAVKQMLETGKVYQIAGKMGVKSTDDVVNKGNSGNYFTFTVVRHPLDRVLSGYRDRILDGCTGQSKGTVPSIFKTLKIPVDQVMDKKTKCVQKFPTFEEFLKFIVVTSEKGLNPHWDVISKRCSPCLVNYDAIIKLETVESDQQYVMDQSGIGELTQIEMKHQTTGGKTEKFREEFFSKISCDLLIKVYQVYRPDFEFFEYDIDPFDKLCIKT